MILEAAPLQVKAGQSSAFETAFSEAQRIISAMPGYRSHELQRCLEREGHYLLLVRWDSVSAHEEGFRRSPQYQQWRKLLHHFYDPVPTVLHFEAVAGASASDAPQAVVQHQLDAYNAKDIEGLLATYAPDAEQYALHGERLAKGNEEIRARFLARFAEPDLKADLLARSAAGNFVVDHEVVTRNFPEGRGSVEMICVYEVVDGRIRRASFGMGRPVIPRVDFVNAGA
jgi:heme-degrading monooxygenase HmoA